MKNNTLDLDSSGTDTIYQTYYKTCVYWCLDGGKSFSVTLNMYTCFPDMISSCDMEKTFFRIALNWFEIISLSVTVNVITKSNEKFNLIWTCLHSKWSRDEVVEGQEPRTGRAAHSCPECELDAFMKCRCGCVSLCTRETIWLLTMSSAGMHCCWGQVGVTCLWYWKPSSAGSGSSGTSGDSAEGLFFTQPGDDKQALCVCVSCLSMCVWHASSILKTLFKDSNRDNSAKGLQNFKLLYGNFKFLCWKFFNQKTFGSFVIPERWVFHHVIVTGRNLSISRKWHIYVQE